MSSSVCREPRQVQKRMRQLEAEAAGLRAQLCRAQRLATVGTMAAMVAHEFNNILTPIVNYAQLARTNPKLAEKAIDKAANGGESRWTFSLGHTL